MKILFSDLDGTLIFNNQIKDEDKAAIVRFQNASNKFAFCTGRGIAAVTYLLNELKPDYLNLNSGALLLDGSTSEIYQNSISKDTANFILDNLGVKTIATIIYTDKNMYLTGATPYNYDSFPVVESINDVNETIVGLGCIFTNKSDAAIATSNLKKLKDGSYDVFQNEASLDVVADGCSKGKSILKLAEILNINLNDIYCIGDSYNDLSMFECVPNSFTFNSSDQPIKDACKYLVDSVAEAIDVILEDN